MTSPICKLVDGLRLKGCLIPKRYPHGDSPARYLVLATAPRRDAHGGTSAKNPPTRSLRLRDFLTECCDESDLVVVRRPRLDELHDVVRLWFGFLRSWELPVAVPPTLTLAPHEPHLGTVPEYALCDATTPRLECLVGDVVTKRIIL